MNANKTKEDEWIEVVSGHRRRTKQIATSKVLDKRQVEMDNRYHMLRNLQEMNRVVGDQKIKKN